MITLLFIYIFLVMLLAHLGFLFSIAGLALKLVLAVSVIYVIYELIFDRENFLKK